MKYLNFEGLQYFYSKLSSSLAGKHVSQSNLKTINGQSLLGSGNITIEGGAGGDYLPLSGGTLTGNVNMTGDNPIFKLTGRNGYSITLQPEGENSDPSITIESSDGAPKVQVINDEGTSKLTGTELAFSHNFGDLKSRFSGNYIQIGDRSKEFIYVSSSGIEKNGGNNTTVFTTDGGTASLSTVGDGKYLPLNEGGVVRGTSLEDVEHEIYISVSDIDSVARLELNKAGVLAKKENEDIIFNTSENGAFILWFGAASAPTNASSAAVTNVDFGVNSEGCYIKGKKLEVPEALTQEEIEAICV